MYLIFDKIIIIIVMVITIMTHEAALIGIKWGKLPYFS